MYRPVQAWQIKRVPGFILPSNVLLLLTTLADKQPFTLVQVLDDLWSNYTSGLQEGPSSYVYMHIHTYTYTHTHTNRASNLTVSKSVCTAAKWQLHIFWKGQKTPNVGNVCEQHLSPEVTATAPYPRVKTQWLPLLKWSHWLVISCSSHLLYEMSKKGKRWVLNATCPPKPSPASSIKSLAVINSWAGWVCMLPNLLVRFCFLL